MAKIALMVGTVYGAAEYVAEQAQALLTELGHSAQLFTEAKLDDVLALNADIWLVITSTTGQGDIPDNLLPFYLDVQNRFPLLTGKQFAVIALGDSSYATFCGAGELMEEALYETSARKVGDTLRIDALETTEPEMEAVPWVREWLEQL